MSLQKIQLPKMGESVAEATIIKWHKQVGDAIERDEIFVEIGTDKVDSELPSTHEGVLKEIMVQEGETVATGTIICAIEIDGKATENTTETVEKNTVIEEVQTEVIQEKPSRSKTTEEGVFLSPVVRKMITRHNISTQQLATIKGSGQKNRITKKDIEKLLAPKETTANTASVPGIYIPPKRDLRIEAGDNVQQLSRIRQVIAKNMLESVQTIPHVTTVVEVDVSEMVYLREKEKASFLETHGTKITYTHILMHAIVSVLYDFPKINAWMNGNNELIIKKHVALGFAAALPDGNLVVPNIKHAEELSLVGLVKEVNAIANKAKAGQLPGDAYTNSTFTISNTGIFGSQFGTPIISVPQVAVLALGAIEKKAAVFLQDNKEHVAIRNMMHLSLSYDHRVIDGAYASQFLSAIKNKLEQLKTLQ